MAPYSRSWPVALTIAGSDSGGGAGLQADLKTFASLGVHGTSAVVCVTAQNPRAVTAIHACPPGVIRAQLEAVFSELRPAAAKTGMLFFPAIIREVARFIAKNPVPLVVDPVMIATSGAKLSQPAAVRTLTRELLPHALVVTPNLSETEVLTGRKIASPDDMREAAREIHKSFGCAALVKGGHLPDSREAVDVLCSSEGEWLFTAPYVRGVSTHGTGCTYSAAITAHLALGLDLPAAVLKAKEYVTQAIACHVHAGEHTVLNHFYKTNP